MQRAKLSHTPIRRIGESRFCSRKPKNRIFKNIPFFWTIDKWILLPKHAQQIQYQWLCCRHLHHSMDWWNSDIHQTISYFTL